MRNPPLPAALAVLGLTALLASNARADQLPNPVVTAQSRPFNASYTAANLFDTANGEFASASQGAIAIPFTTNTLNGTWVELDFGDTVQFDRFVMTARQNAVDVVGESRLIVSDDPVFSAADQIFTFNPSGANGSGIVRVLPSVATGRYVRWEVTTRTGSGLNLGGNQMWFLNTPAGRSRLPNPVVIGSSTPFNASYVAANAVNGDFGVEYASLGGQANTFIDFDFGTPRTIAGFEFLNRLVDRITTYEVLFSDTQDFAQAHTTLPFTASLNGNFLNTQTFDPITARYVRLKAKGFTGANNTGIREIQFFTLVGQPPAIGQQPTGATRLAGDSFTLTAGGISGDAPLHFQWYRDNAVLPNGTNLALILSPLTVADSGDYHLVVTNNYGSATSLVANLTVLDPPVDTLSDLRLWLRFDELEGLVAVDESGYAHDGTLAGFAGDNSQWVPGRIDGSLRVNADPATDDDVVLVQDDGTLDFSSTMEFTLSAWVNGPAAQESSAGIIAKGNGGGNEQFAIDFANGFRFFGWTGNAGQPVYNISTTLTPNDTWQHVVAVFSRSLNRLKLYVNGVEVASGTPPSTLVGNNHDVSIGSRQLSSGPYNLNFKGRLDDVRIYARPLTPADVTALFNEASALPPVINSQPTGGTFLAGEPVTLSVAADGTPPLRYQWFLNDQPVADATNASLTLPAITPAQAGTYTVTVSNTRDSVDSDPAVVIVNDPAPNFTAGLLLHLKLDETSGTVAIDSSGAAHDGNLQGFADPLWTAGIIDGALAFNPDDPATADDVLVVPYSAEFDLATQPVFSISLWAKGSPDQEGGAGVLCHGPGFNEQICIDVFNGYRVYSRAPGGGLASFVQLGVGPDNTWQHLVVLYDTVRGTSRVYVNGVLAGNAAAAALLPSSADLSVGSRALAGSVYDLNFNGQIDDVRLYDRILTPREIRCLRELAYRPALSVARSGGSVTVSWPLAFTGYVLESASEMPALSWTEVPGVANNQVQLDAVGGAQFFRLRKQ